MKYLGFLAAAIVVAALGTAAPGDASAASTCVFDTNGTTMTLQADCTTDNTIFVPDGTTLDGAGHTITAVDPEGGKFQGAVVQNDGPVAHVTNVTITADGLGASCKTGNARLAGIRFDGASGSITQNNVVGINQGASGCQEGNAIEVRNAPFDGTHPATVTVEIAHNTVLDYQKTGIVTNGDIDAHIHHNNVGASATQTKLAANSIQVGFGAKALVEHNQIAGNQWLGASDYYASAILIYQSAPGTVVRQNNISGNADIGIAAEADGVEISNNRVFDNGADGGHYDIGIGAWGTDNVVTNNKVRGYDIAYDGFDVGDNKVVGGPAAAN